MKCNFCGEIADSLIGGEKACGLCRGAFKRLVLKERELMSQERRDSEQVEISFPEDGLDSTEGWSKAMSVLVGLTSKGLLKESDYDFHYCRGGMLVHPEVIEQLQEKNISFEIVNK